MTSPSNAINTSNVEPPSKSNFKFPQLPKELRLKVIKFAVLQERRYIAVKFDSEWDQDIIMQETIDNRERLKQLSPPSKLLSVNDEFRTESRRLLRPIQPSVPGQNYPDIFIDPRNDTVYIPEGLIELYNALEQIPLSIAPTKAILNLATPWKRFVVLLHTRQIVRFLFQLRSSGVQKISLLINERSYEFRRPWHHFIASEPEELPNETLLRRMKWFLVDPIDKKAPEDWDAMVQVVEKRVNKAREENFADGGWTHPEFVFREIKERDV